MQIRIGDKVYKNDCRQSRYYEDLVKLQNMMEELGFPKLDLNTIEEMWESISDKYFACWLMVPTDKES